MCWAAGIELPRQVFSHGFVTVDGTKMGKSIGNVVQPLEIIAKSSVDAYRYFFMRECAFPGDGDYSGQRYEEVYNSELANKLGNLLSRCITVGAKSFDAVLTGTAGRVPEKVTVDFDAAKVVAEVRLAVEHCEYNLALQAVILKVCTPANQYIDAVAPWKLVKGSAEDIDRAKSVIFNVIHCLRIASILLKPFLPRSAEIIYTSFNFPKPWAQVTYADAAELAVQPDDLRITAELVDGKVKQLFPKIA